VGFPAGTERAVSFDHLVRTTFLNVEAVAAEIFIVRGRPRPVYSAGFFEAIDARVLDINYEPNPHPGLCVVRAISAGLRLNWALSRRLSSYIITQASAFSVDQLTEIQRSHYGKIRIPQVKMLGYLESIEEQLQSDAQTIKLPIATAEQLHFSTYSPSAY